MTSGARRARRHDDERAGRADASPTANADGRRVAAVGDVLPARGRAPCRTGNGSAAARDS